MDLVDSITEYYRSWDHIGRQHLTYAAIAAFAGGLVAGPGGLLAGAPVIANLFKSAISRLWIDYQDDTDGYFIVECAATGSVMGVTAVALPVFTQMRFLAVAVVVAIIGSILLVESLYVAVRMVVKQLIFQKMNGLETDKLKEVREFFEGKLKVSPQNDEQLKAFLEAPSFHQRANLVGPLIRAHIRKLHPDRNQASNNAGEFNNLMSYWSKKEAKLSA